jgi:Patatin-like phospholipase
MAPSSTQFSTSNSSQIFRIKSAPGTFPTFESARGGWICRLTWRKYCRKRDWSGNGPACSYTFATRLQVNEASLHVPRTFTTRLSPRRDPLMIATGTPEVNKQPRLLSMDGGGVRGLSSLLILKEIMLEIKRRKTLDKIPLPCDYFDLMGGTSTGGVIAIMLGRLRMVPICEKDLG